jgi:hypothetical protein
MLATNGSGQAKSRLSLPRPRGPFWQGQCWVGVAWLRRGRGVEDCSRVQLQFLLMAPADISSASCRSPVAWPVEKPQQKFREQAGVLVQWLAGPSQWSLIRILETGSSWTSSDIPQILDSQATSSHSAPPQTPHKSLAAASGTCDELIDCGGTGTCIDRVHMDSYIRAIQAAVVQIK